MCYNIKHILIGGGSMTLQNLFNQAELREQYSSNMEYATASKVLIEFFETCSNKEKPYVDTGNYVEDLLYNYFLLKGTVDGKLLENIMKQYHFDYSMSIHNAIYYLLGQECELSELNSDPLLWPGVSKILGTGSDYQLNTNLGIIKVSRASDLFKDTSSSYIFDRQLMGRCYDRSYDFVKENSDKYKVVLSYMPNFFEGGHYHAYLENDSGILDIAANSFYRSKENAKSVLCGDIIKKLTYSEIEDSYSDIQREIPDVDLLESSKLHTLALYYDYKNRL